MRRKVVSLFLIAAMCLPLPISAAETAQSAETAQKIIFSDVSENHKAYDAVSYLAEQGIINGKSEKLYCPDDSLKREEFAKILTNAFGLKSLENAPVFYDVPARTWYADYVAKVAVSGLMQGTSQNSFGTGYTLSRQDLALILKRFLDRENVALSQDSTIIYADSNDVADYAKEAVSALSGCGIMLGKEDNLWRPEDDVTRADAALAVYNALMYQKEYSGSMGRLGPSEQYDPPYDVIVDDRLAEAKPTVFDANIWPRGELFYEDFEDDDYDNLVKQSGFAENVSFDAENGYGGGTCIKINSSSDTSTYPCFKYTGAPGEIVPGDFLVMTAKVRTEDLAGDGSVRGLLQVYDDNDEWITESWDPQIYVSTVTKGEWTEYQWIRNVKEKLNDLDPPKFYTLKMGCYVKGVTGTVYFDDMKVSIVKFHPMDTVLMTPNYKGIIKGENGVGDISLRAYLNEDNGFYDFNDFKFTAQITDADHNVLLQSESDTVTKTMDVYFSSSTLPMNGNYYLETILTDKNTGEVVQKDEWVLHKRDENFETVVDYDKYGRILFNGEAVLPMGVYSGPLDEQSITNIMNSNVDNNLNQRMTTMLNYGEDEEIRTAIDRLAENGMNITLAVGNFTSGTTFSEIIKNCKTLEDKRGMLSKMVNNFKDLPNLFSWYLYDELNPMQYGKELEWFRKIVENVDLDHPTKCAIADPLDRRPGVYSKTSDFLGFDPYPVTGAPDQDLSKVTEFMKTAKKTNPNRPFYCILQGFYYQTRGDLRAPYKEEFRNMAYQALCEGAAMLDVYSISYIRNTPSPDKPWQESWKDYTDVLAEIQYLEPVILSTIPAPYYEIKGGEGWLSAMSKHHEGKSYFFAVNTENTGKIARINLDGAKKITGMYSGKIYEEDSNGWFEIEMEGCETEVFVYEQAEYKSAHAELKSFGLSSCVMTDSESAPCFIVSGDKTEVEYSSAISDYAKLYINGEERETTGKLNVEGVSEITVKVVSEDGRFSTEKIYKVEHR